MKFVCISDTHFMHDRQPIPEGDVLIHAGDFGNTGDPEEIQAFNTFLGTLPHKYKIVIAGNHDYFFESNPEEARALLTNGVYLEDSEVAINGVRVYGSPWTPWFNDWAFNLPRGKLIRAKWDLIPEGIDILVTHGPPQGQGDRDNKKPLTSEHLGCEDLMQVVKRVKPRYHVFGHIHSGYGVSEDDQTVYINAAMCTETYAPTNPPVVFDFSES